MSEVTLLIIDDSGVMRKVLKYHLSGIGYSNVVEAVNGAEGLKKLSEQKVDLIFCDWNMPEMNGLQFIQAVKSKETYQNIPLIMVTTISTQDEVVAALEAGARTYITKPFTKDDLKAKIDSVLEAGSSS